jgi:hypothetical protein
VYIVLGIIMDRIIRGTIWPGRNWAADAEGSIHDDDTASDLGFRGGTVPGDVHMNQFPPILVEVFGRQWFECGNLSLYFQNATVDKELVQVFSEELPEGKNQVRVWMNRDDNLPVAAGTAAVGDHTASELQIRDLRPGDPADLKILSKVHANLSLGEYDHFASPERQFQLYDQGLISDPLEWYRTTSPWGEVIAAPSTIVQILWGVPMDGLRPFVGEAVCLFGAIEIGHVNGPLFLNREYHLTSEVVCVGQSPKTEYLWFDTIAFNKNGAEAATLRMLLRFMKASSPLCNQ